MVLSKMNNHEHQTKQTYESYTFQPLMSFCRNQNHTPPTPSHVAVYMGKVLLIHTEELIVLLLTEILF